MAPPSPPSPIANTPAPIAFTSSFISFLPASNVTLFPASKLTSPFTSSFPPTTLMSFPALIFKSPSPVILLPLLNDASLLVFVELPPNT